MPCWYFERKEIKNSPSFRDNIDPATENRYRREGARFIIDAGTKMGLRYDTCATGVIYFHRFYMFHSFKEFYRYVTAACCLFLAGKVEETPKKCKDIIKIAQSLLSPASFLRFGEDPREEVMTMERILLKTIKFDLQVDHPYSCMLKIAKHFKGDKEKVQKMAQMAWTFINDSMCTTLCLQWEPEIVAVSLMYLASRLTKYEPTDWSGKTSSKGKWWEDFVEGLTLELMEDVCHQVLDLYSKQKKQVDADSPPQSPAKDARQSSPPPPPPPPDRTPGKRSREVTPSESEAASKSSRHEKKSSQSQSDQSSTSAPTGAPIPVARHASPPPVSHSTYSSLEPPPSSEFSSYNPYVSSHMYTASFMSQEGSQNIQSILAGSAPPPKMPAAPYPDPHLHHPPPAETQPYPPPSLGSGPEVSYNYPPSQSQYPPPPQMPPHSYPPPQTAAAPQYDHFTNPSYPPPASSFPPPPVSQAPAISHTYPPPSLPPPQSYGSYYPQTSHAPGSHPSTMLQPPRGPNFPTQPPQSYSGPPPQSGPPPAQNFGQPRHRGTFHKHGRHNQTGQRDIPALTEIKITGRPEWNHP